MTILLTLCHRPREKFFTDRITNNVFTSASLEMRPSLHFYTKWNLYLMWVNLLKKMKLILWWALRVIVILLYRMKKAVGFSLRVNIYWSLSGYIYILLMAISLFFSHIDFNCTLWVMNNKRCPSYHKTELYVNGWTHAMFGNRIITPANCYL